MGEPREPGDDQDTYGIPVAELLRVEIDPAKWIIPGYVQEQAIAVLAGPPNVGKTLLGIDWCAQAVAAGKRVFVGQNEGGLRGLQDRLRRACAAAGIADPPDRFTYRRNMDVALSDLRAIKDMATELANHDLLFLDSLSSFWPGLNENDPQHMSMVAEALKILTEYSGASTLGNHHTTKATWKPGEKPSLADIRGHGALAGRIDAAFICVPPKDRAAGLVRFDLHVVKQRDEDWAPPKACEVLMTGPAAIVEYKDIQNRTEGKAPSKADVREASLVTEILKVCTDVASSANEVYRRLLNGTPDQRRLGGHKPDTMKAIKECVRNGKLQAHESGGVFKPVPEKPNGSSRFNRFNENQNRTGSNPDED